jgi:hypothetical protein
MLSHFRNWDHALLFMDKYFLHLRSQHKLYYLNKVRTCEQGTTVKKYKEKVKLSHQNCMKDARVKI